MISQVSPEDITGGTLPFAFSFHSPSSLPPPALGSGRTMGAQHPCRVKAGAMAGEKEAVLLMGSRKCAPTAHLEGGASREVVLDVYGFRQLLAERDLEKLRRAVDFKPSAPGLRSAVI